MILKKYLLSVLALVVVSGIGVFALVNAPTSIALSAEVIDESTNVKYGVDELVKEIETRHCLQSDAELESLKLSPEKIKKKHEFCNLTSGEKKQVLLNEFQKLGNLGQNKSIVSGYQNSYTCFFDGLNVGIPTYQDLGLTSSSCTWTDPNPVCKSQGSVACLWGCTNKDHKLGWKTKTFSSKTLLENEIKSKGYFQANTGLYSGLSYTRQLPYGYRYEVQGPSNGVGSFASEGPEPDPGFNWYAVTSFWWPVEVGLWHVSC